MYRVSDSGIQAFEIFTMLQCLPAAAEDHSEVFSPSLLKRLDASVKLRVSQRLLVHHNVIRAEVELQLESRASAAKASGSV